jgi:predicted DNA-binding transcriptional regulator AlpA
VEQEGEEEKKIKEPKTLKTTASKSTIKKQKKEGKESGCIPKRERMKEGGFVAWMETEMDDPGRV